MTYPSILIDSESLIKDLGPYAVKLKELDVSMTDVFDGVLDVVSAFDARECNEDELVTVILETVWEHISLNAQVEERPLENLYDIEANALEAALIMHPSIDEALQPYRKALIAGGVESVSFTLTGFLDNNVVVGVNNVSTTVHDNIYG